VDSAAAAGVTLRLLGGVAVALRCPSAMDAVLARHYGDIDLVGLRSERARIVSLMTDLGYVPDERLNSLHGRARLFFWDVQHGRRADVFLDTFEMCHLISFADRLALDKRTLTLADLLATKLQVFETSDKDYRDLIAILVDHPFVEGPELSDGIDASRLSALTGDDWGLWRTFREVTERTVAFSGTLRQPLPGAYSVDRQVTTLIEVIDAAPKSRRWRTRSWVGERKRWYQIPEDTTEEMKEYH
jgi:hypothetical protein